MRIQVPYSASGYRFSVEFAPQNFTLTDNSGKDNASGVIPPTEPRNAMLVFAEPMSLTTGVDVPTSSDGKILNVTQGNIRSLDNTDAEILVFKPGPYYMGANYRAMLPRQVRWIYLAPGAYVKGAFEFQSSGDVSNYKVTGLGVLSGEQYVYEADTRNDGTYSRRDPAKYGDCHGD